MPFTTADDYFRARPGRRSAVEWIVRQSWPHHRAKFQEPEGFGGTVTAVINHDRWLVHCPGACNGAQFACESDPRFFCVDCLHEGTAAEGKWLRVLWPSEQERAAIERALRLRPARFRNWAPPETARDLEQENVDMRTLARGALLLESTGKPQLPGDLASMENIEFEKLAPDVEQPKLGEGL